MEEKLLVIKFNQLGMMVDVMLYVRTKVGLVLLSSFIIEKGVWEDVKKAIDAEYVDLDKPTQ
jgi:hypothetical protein